MPSYTTGDIRNIALVGHSGAGKTSLAEAMLHRTKVTTRLGSVTDGTSHLDFTEEEKERRSSIDPAICSVPFEGKTINIVDTPGSPDFLGPGLACLAAVETAVCVISATAGIEVNTRRMMEKAKEYGLARMIVINKMDSDNADLARLVTAIKEMFGQQCICLNLPGGGGKQIVDCLDHESGDPDFGKVAESHTRCVEAVVEIDETAMEEYLGSGTIEAAKVHALLPKAMAAGAIVPIIFTGATHDIGVEELMHLIVEIAPSPLTGLRRKLKTGDAEQELSLEAKGKLVGQVFRVMGDPKTNIRYSAIRIHAGTLRPDTAMHVGDEKKAMRPGQLYKMLGADHKDIDSGIPGDIVAVPKLELSIGSVVYEDTPGEIAMPTMPSPMFALAIEPKSRGDAEKVSVALHRYTEEDPCFHVDRDAATHELVIRGLGDLHLRTILGRIEKYFKLPVETKVPKIPYRETILSKVESVEYTHKKQTGGAGQFGRVVINMEPNERGKGYEFVDKIFGGAIDLVFRPSVDKGCRQVLTEGVLAGYPIVDVKVTLVDGKTHPVDSKDIAFTVAGREAFKLAFMKCKPALLEPLVIIEVVVPAEKMGDITGDLASRRGRPIGQDMLPGGMAVIRAEVPLAEVADYNSRLSSITGGQGSYSMELSRYEMVPGNVAQQIVEAAKKAREAAHAH